MLILFSSVLIKVSLSIDGKSFKLKYIVVLVLVFTMSLMHMLKINGPNMEPCGIPVFISIKFD